MSSLLRKTLLSAILILQLCYLGNAEVYAIPGTGYLPATVRAACRTALAVNITECSFDLMQQAVNILPEELDAICTTPCLNALNSMRATALTRCGTDSVIVPVDNLEPPTNVSLVPLNFADELVYKYQSVCLKGGPDQSYCKGQLVNMTQEKQCLDCNLQKTQMQLNSPFEYQLQDKAEFTSLLSSCGVAGTSYPVTYVPTATEIPTGEPMPSCTSSYIAKQTDTANSVAKALQVSTDRLLTYNNLPLNMNGTFTAGEALCLDNVSKCVTQAVQSGDTCTTYLNLIGNNLSEYMLRSWNPTFGHDCSNLQFMIGKMICIGPPGPTPTSYSEATATATSSITTSTAPDTLTWTQPATAVTTFTSSITTGFVYWPPTMPAIATITSDAPAASVISAALARLSHCPFMAYGDETWTDGLNSDEWKPSLYDLDDACQEEWDPYCFANISAPILPSPVAIPSSCYPNVITVTPKYVEPPAATQSGSPTNCNKWHIAASGDTCDAIDSKYGITLAQLKAWNPSINAVCSNILAKYAYCVRVYVETALPTSTSTSSATVSTTLSPPAPTGSGTSAACYKWHVMTTGDTCASIASAYGIIVSRFRQLNRGVTTACDNLVDGNAYCVAA